MSLMNGLGMRTTRDADFTITGINLDPAVLTEILQSILTADSNDTLLMNIANVDEIRNEDAYPGYRFSVTGQLDSLRLHAKIDTSTGDQITPMASKRTFQLPLSNERITLWVYPLETILAEKLETILVRAEASTRMRDYFDVYLLAKHFDKDMDPEALSKALINTMNHRKTLHLFETTTDIIRSLYDSTVMRQKWMDYQTLNNYVGAVSYDDAILVIMGLMEQIAKHTSTKSG